MIQLGKELKTGNPIGLDDAARSQGLYLIGNTGTGKSTVLQNIALQDMEKPDRQGLCVIDPHGDLVQNLLTLVPHDRLEDVILFAPGSDEQLANPLGLNLFDCDRNNPREVRRVASTIVDTLKKLFFYSWGPRMEDLLRVAVLSLIAQENTSLLELMLILASKIHREKYTANVTDSVLQHYWQVQFSAYEANARMLIEVVGSSLNKIGRFLSDPVIRNVVAQTKSSFSVSDAMKQGKILFVDLSKGHLGEENSRLLGAVIVNLILVGALERRDTTDRKPFNVIVDEFQNFATESFATLQSEARKYNITLTVAHQYRGQLDEENLGSTLNVGNLMVMRVSGADSFELASQFDNTPPEPEKRMERVYVPDRQREGLFVAEKSAKSSQPRYHEVADKPRAYNDVVGEKANQLAIQPRFRAHCRFVEGRDLKEYVIDTDPLQGSPLQDTYEYLVAQWGDAGTPKKDVEKDIRARLGEIQFDVPEFRFGE